MPAIAFKLDLNIYGGEFVKEFLLQSCANYAHLAKSLQLLGSGFLVLGSWFSFSKVLRVLPVPRPQDPKTSN